MKNFSFTILVICVGLLCISCRKAIESKGSTVNPDTVFQRISDEFIKSYLTWRPQVGTYLGLHEYDGGITDFSKASLAKELATLKEYETKLEGIAADSLSARMRVDLRILLSAIKREIMMFEDLKIYEVNPMTYAATLDVNIYVKRDFAPIEERVRSIIAIEQKARAIFMAARENLADSLPRPYVQTAIQMAEGVASFLDKDMASALKDVGDDSLKQTFAAVNREAVKEIREFATFLKRDKLPKTHNKYAIGKENYGKMLLYNEMLTTSPEEILKMGMEELKKEQALFALVAKKINPRKKPIEVFEDMKKDHPKAENLITDARKNLESIRQFIVDKDLITIPSEVRVSLQETLPYARSTSTASMDTPGPFEKKATQAYYYITPVEKDWSAKKKEEWLSLFGYYVTDIISIHEAYPGHYVQFLHLNASKATDVEKIFGSYAFVEGWAHYTEKMMIEEGFGAKDSLTAAKYHLAQLDESLIRLARLCVSIKTHCEGMTVDDATRFIQDNAYYAYEGAHHEAMRGTYDPGYLSYTLGKLQILKLREDYKKQKGDSFSLKEFHDTFLSYGMPPIELIRELMINQAVE